MNFQPRNMPTVSADEHHKMPAYRAPIICFLSIFLAGLVLRTYGIGGKPFWMDEITTIQRASLPLRSLVHQGLIFHQLPAFFVVTSWVLPFGHSEFFVRLPAILFGALSCALGFGVARTLAGNAAGLTAGLLLACSPAMVQYGQEARSYTMMICAILIALWGLVALARDPARASAKLRSQGGLPLAWAGYTMGTVAALSILSDALFWLLAANLAAIAIARHKTAHPPGFWHNWAAAQVVILAFCLPWFGAITLLGQRGVMGGVDWVQPLTAQRFWWSVSSTYMLYVTSLITVRVFPPGVPGFGIAVVILALAGCLALRRRGAAFPVVAAAILVLPLSLIAISLARPVLMPRYLLWSGAIFCICAGTGVSLLPRRLQLPSAAAIGLLGLLNLLPYYQDETKPRWDLASEELRAGLQSGDLVLVDDPQAVQMMNIYLNRDTPPRPVEFWTTNAPQAAAWRAAGGRVWAIQGKVGQADHESQAEFFRRIPFAGPPDFEEHAGLDILLARYDPVSQASAHRG